jgi:hypothetical protein
MKKCFLAFWLSPLFAFAQDQTINGNLTVNGTGIFSGSVQSTQFWMKSGDNQTHFVLQTPTTYADPFKITLGYQNISGGIMIGREDWLSKVLIPWKVGIANTTPQKNLDVNTGANDFITVGATLGDSQWSGLHFGYKESANNLYRKSAIVFQRDVSDNSARGKVHILNNNATGSASAGIADAKLTIDYNANIGIDNPSPQEKIHVGGSGRVNARIGRWASFGETHSGLATIIGTNAKASNAAIHRMEFIESTGDGAKAIKMQYNEGISFHTYLGSVVAGQEFTGYERMRIDNSGNVLINQTNTNPTGDKVQIGGEGYINLRLGRWGALGETSGAIATVLGNNVKASTNAYNRLEFISGTPDGGKAIKLQYNEGITFHTYQGTSATGQEFTGYERMRIDNSGNVGIGTSSPDAKLAVKGTVHTQEVKVDLLGAVAPDYVFEKNYNLLSLEDIAAYVADKKHLPEVPSAREMETNGINLKAMNLLLLKKVEELTLYLIELNRSVELQKKINDTLTNEIQLLKNK